MIMLVANPSYSLQIYYSNLLLKLFKKKGTLDPIYKELGDPKISMLSYIISG